MDPWAAKNERRLRLIEKKHAEGLSLQEARELDRLKREVYNHLQSVDPRSTDVLDDIDSRLDSLKKKLEAKRGKKVSDPTGLQVLKKCRVSGRRHFCHPTSFQGRGCKNGRSTEDPASGS